MTSYYVDKTLGDDSNNGTSQSTPWETLAKLKDFGFLPDDRIYLKRGESWNECLNFTDSGSGMSDVIIIDAYGTGPKPLISYEYLRWPIAILDGDYVIMKNIHMKTGNGYGARVRGEHVNVDYCEIEDTGLGVGLQGNYGKARHNHIHDLHVMETGEGGPEDYGAVGVPISGAINCEVSYNFFRNCTCETVEFGWSGGVIELIDDVSNASIHDNVAVDSWGLFEAGSNSLETMTNVSIRDNMAINCSRVGGIHFEGSSYGCVIDNFQVERNIFVDMNQKDSPRTILWFQPQGSNPSASELTYRRNIHVMTSDNERPFLGWGNDGMEEDPNFDFSDNFFIVNNISHIPMDYNSARIMGAYLQLLGF